MFPLNTRPMRLSPAAPPRPRAARLLLSIVLPLAAAAAAAGAPAPPPAPPHSDPALRRAGQYFNEGRYHDAAKEYDQAILSHPNDPKLYAARGDARVQCQQFQNAVRDYDKALKLGLADKAWLYTARGDAKAYSGDYAGALADYQKAINTNKNYAFAYAQRALVLEEMGRLDEALADCTRSIELSKQGGERKSLPLAYTQRSAVYRKMGKLQEAIADCQEAMRLSPRFPPAFKHLGDALVDMGQLRTAIGCYNCAIDLKRDYAQAYYQRGLAYQKTGHPQRGQQDLKRARQIDPDVAENPLWKR